MFRKQLYSVALGLGLVFSGVLVNAADFPGPKVNPIFNLEMSEKLHAEAVAFSEIDSDQIYITTSTAQPNGIYRDVTITKMQVGTPEKIIWQTKAKTYDGLMRLTVIKMGQTEQLVLTGGTEVEFFDQNGKQLEYTKIADLGPIINRITPYVNAKGQQFVLVTTTDTEAYRLPEAFIACFDVRTGKLLYKQSGSDWDVKPVAMSLFFYPVVTKDAFYVFSNETVLVVEPEQGRVIKSFKVADVFSNPQNGLFLFTGDVSVDSRNFVIFQCFDKDICGIHAQNGHLEHWQHKKEGKLTSWWSWQSFDLGNDEFIHFANVDYAPIIKRERSKNNHLQLVYEKFPLPPEGFDYMGQAFASTILRDRLFVTANVKGLETPHQLMVIDTASGEILNYFSIANEFSSVKRVLLKGDKLFTVTPSEHKGYKSAIRAYSLDSLSH